MGDTGAGKSTLIKQILQQIEDRGENAIVYDPAGEFTECFYQRRPGRLDSESAGRPFAILDAIE